MMALPQRLDLLLQRAVDAWMAFPPLLLLMSIMASLSFLGLGVPPLYPTWGGMLSLAGLDHMYQTPWLAIWPAVALSLAVFGFYMLGDALRDLLDPRLKGG